MSLENYRKMDPLLLVGLVNTELRNYCEDLHDLCRTHDIDEAILCERLASQGFIYQADQKAFR